MLSFPFLCGLMSRYMYKCNIKCFLIQSTWRQQFDKYYARTFYWFTQSSGTVSIVVNLKKKF